MRNVGIVGCGLIGTSFGLALRKHGYPGAIFGVSSPRSTEAAMARGAIDSALSLEEAAARCDMLFLAQPVTAILATLGVIAPLVNPNALVTDAGSTKGAVVAEAQRVFTRGQFIGGHPIAGKEARGAEAADAGLFAGCTWILTETPDHPITNVFRKWLRLFGARVVVMDAAQHDRLLAWSSHLPQLLSSALAAAVQEQMPGAAATAGSGLRDMTRLALSSWDVWGDIVRTNEAEIGAALDACIAKLQELREHPEEVFRQGNALAHALRSRSAP